MPSIRTSCPTLPDGLAHDRRRLPAQARWSSASRARPSSCAAREAAARAAPAAQLAEGESPYPGLTAFQEADADRFFGRTPRRRAHGRAHPRAAAHRRRRAVGRRQVVVRARRRRARAQALRRALGGRHAAARAASRSPRSRASSQRLTTRSRPDVQTQVDEHHAADAAPAHRARLPRHAAARARARQTDGQILLFVDQFEELYTLVPDRRRAPRVHRRARRRRRRHRGAAARRRVDALGLPRSRRRGPAVHGGAVARPRVPVSRPIATACARRSIAPLEMVGYRFESAAMVEDMLDALDGTPGALPLLQFAAAKLWDARDRQRRMLTRRELQRDRRHQRRARDARRRRRRAA